MMQNESNKARGVARADIELYLNNLLEVPRFRDYCPNGLQVEGVSHIRHIVSGVTASQALLEAAVATGADTVLVHHGYFWKGEDARVVGIKQRRLQTLLVNQLNLLAYHLPLDNHPTLGNNAQLALKLGLEAKGRFGENEIGWLGEWSPDTVSELGGTSPVASVCATHISQQLGRQALLVGDAHRPVRRVAWCTGGAQGYFEEAIAQGVDLYISGEISEQTTHLARESGVAYIAAGHHATECYGVQALGRHLAEQFGVAHTFIEIANPV